MAKPATLDGYSDQYTLDCERVLVTLLRGLGPWKDSVYLVGGLTPRYLVAARPPVVDFENEGGETYVCGNPPYVGGKKQTAEQKNDMLGVFGRGEQHKNLDYICAFIIKTYRFLNHADKAALVNVKDTAQQA